MKVELKDVLPNPYRNLPEYPIDTAKIERLKASIKQTGFWDNIVARKRKDGKVEIAYGHHRMEALRKMYPKNHAINIIVRDLEDGTMIQIMASENDEVYSLGPGVINETVRAARDYLREHPDSVRAGTHIRKDDRHREAVAIAVFLSWPQQRVEESLAQLTDIAAGTIDRDVLESLPTQKVAERFRQAIKKHNAPKTMHRFIADKIKTGKIGSRQVADEVIRQRYKEKKAPVQLERYLWGVKKDAARLIDSIEKLSTVRDEINSDIYAASFEKSELFRILDKLSAAIASLTGGSHGRTSKETRKLLRS